MLLGNWHSPTDSPLNSEFSFTRAGRRGKDFEEEGEVGAKLKLTGVSRPDSEMAAADVCLEINLEGKEKEMNLVCLEINLGQNKESSLVSLENKSG